MRKMGRVEGGEGHKNRESIRGEARRRDGTRKGREK